MKKKGFKIFTFLLFPVVFVLIFFSFINQTEAACRDYCCGGQDGLGAPDGGNKDEVCGGATWDYYAGACGRVDCVDTRSEKGYCYPWPQQTDQRCCGPYYQICDEVCGNSIKEGDEECDNGDNNGKVCTPSYGGSCTYCSTTCEIKTVNGGSCGDSKVDTTNGEECDPFNSSCTYDSKAGVCTSGCKCCTQCSVSCPSPLVSSKPVNPPHNIDEYFYDNIDSCTDRDVCTSPETRYADCYEVLSPQPTVSLTIHPENVSTYLGFNSNTHTGGGLYETVALGVKDNTVNDFFPYSSDRYPPDSNNLFYMEATFTDGDNPIESTYVWFNKSGIKPITPMYIDLNNDTTPLRYGTQNKEEFGFLLHHNLGVWTPYIPAISGDGDNTGDLWKKATSANGYSQVVEGKTILSIPTVPGANGIISKVLIDSVTYSDNGKKVIIRFSVSFKDTNTSLLSNRPNEGNYKIWLMGNDTFGFTPYDNYEDKAAIVKTAIHNRWITNERIRYYDQWKNNIGASGEEKFWNLNFDPPAGQLTLTPIGGSDIEVKWSFTPDTDLPLEFYASVINLYQSEGLNIDKVKFNGTDFEPELVPADIGTRKIGSLDGTVEKYLTKITSGGGNGSGILSFGNQEVGQGKLFFFFTVFDKGGNVTHYPVSELDLSDWLITQGGLLYSSSININVENRGNPENWSSTNLLSRINHDHADISTELIGWDSFGPSKPVKSIGSYVITPFSNHSIDSYYTTLLERFNRKRRVIQEEIVDLGIIESISGNLSDKGVSDSQIAVVVSTGDFYVSNSFNCNRQGVFFVNGNLTINGKITNGNVNKDACIFVVSGDVTIEEGEKASVSSFNYDEINAYILADKKITINKETGTRYDGLYISGGIHSLNENPESPTEYGVVFKRSLKVGDRLRFPALVVNHHSKYGMLAGRIFGKELIIQSTEVGLKPY